MDGESSRLLVVDDNEMNRDMLSRRLEKRGYRVTMAEDGSEALALLETAPFDLVLLDVMMPGISGLDVLETMRKTHPATELPVIMVTAKDESDDIVTALNLGANDYVTKPLDFPVVLARCRTQLLLRQATQEIEQLNSELEAKNRFIRNTFGRYVSEDVVASVLDSPDGLKLGGEKKVVTLMMADLRGFATLCERLDPEQVVRILNLYLGSMTEVITRFDGTIDEFIGDGIFVMFGAPIAMENHAYRAVECALTMQLALDCVNEELVEEGLPSVQMGIGIHTGEVVVGNVGSEKRAKFGAVGSNVNVTGRIETYSVGGQVLVSESTYEQLQGDATCTDSLLMEGKGLGAPIRLYHVRGLRSIGLEVSTGNETLRSLTSTLPIVITPLDGKHLKSETYLGRIERMSHSGAEIRAGTSLPLWSNVKLHFDGVPDHEDVYAKVVKWVDENGSCFCVRFTSLSDAVERALVDS